jgi:hypothetical protein
MGGIPDKGAIKTATGNPEPCRSRVGGISFDVEMIGCREYRRKMVSVSRSLGRLRQRGLMRRVPFSTGHCLTEMGRAYVDGNG